MKNYDKSGRDTKTKLKSINKYSIGGGIFLIVFCLPFVSVGVFVVLDFLVFKRFGLNDGTALGVAAVFMLVAGVFITFAIRQIVKNVGARRRERRIIENGDIVTAKISDYSCERRVSRSKDSNQTYYYVSFNFSFTARNGENAERHFVKTFASEPGFTEGGRVSVAVLGEDTVILDGHIPSDVSTRELEDMKKADYDAMFYGLDGAELKESDFVYNDFARSQTGEYWQLKLIIASVLIGFYALFMLPLLYFVFFKAMDLMPLPPKLIVIGVLSAATSPALIIGIVIMIKGLKSKKKEKRVLSNCRFTVANFNTITDAYSSSAAPRFTFCFIDYLGNRHVCNIDGLTRRLMTKNMDYSVVAYNGTEAIILHRCYYSYYRGEETAEELTEC